MKKKWFFKKQNHGTDWCVVVNLALNTRGFYKHKITQSVDTLIDDSDKNGKVCHETMHI